METNVSQLPMPAELQPEESRLNIAATIGSVIRSGLESVQSGYDTIRQNMNRYKAIGQSVLAMSGGLAGVAEGINLAVNAEPVGAAEGNIPASVSTAPGSLKQTCATDIFKQPQILHNEMGKPGKKYQDILIQLGFGEVNPTCNGHFKRLAAIRPFLIRHGHIINEDSAWALLLSKGNTNAASDPGEDYVNSHSDPKLYYRQGDRVKFKLRLQEFSVAAKKVVKTVTKTYPVRVEHG